MSTSPRSSLLFRFVASFTVSLGLLVLASPAVAQIAFDASSRAATTTTGRTSLTWSHTIGSGTDRVLVVGVAVEDASTTDANVTSVTYNGVALTAVPSSKINGGGTGIIQTQLFYLLGSSLPVGAFNVVVTFQGAVDGISAGAVSLTGVSQAAPGPAATKVDTSGADSISTSISTPVSNAWVVDVVGSGNSGSFTAGSGQTERWDLAASGMTGAMSTKPVATAGATALAQTHSGANRLAHSLVALSPSAGGGTTSFTLTTSVTGSGSVSRSPNATSYAAGSVVTLTATPAAGFQFAGWSGDLTGTTNPSAVTMNANKSVTATFTQTTPDTFTLTTNVTGSGTVTRSPNATSYASGTVVTLTATPAAGFQFTGWSGDLAGTANPATIVMSANRTVGATFTSTSGNPDFSLYGWAATNGGTTGGAGGQVVTVSTLADLKFYAAQTAPYVIRVSGTITGDEQIPVESNKSILGVGSTARLVGIGFKVGASSRFGLIGNVIFRNLIMEKPLAPIDKFSIQYGAHHIWIDHCELFSDRDHGIDFYDGQADITHGADFVTISWTVFHDHYKNSLVGHSDSNAAEDTGHLTVTYHHNFFVRVDGRNPSIRFGTGHVYNNYFLDIPDYGIASRMGARIRVENNYFQNVVEPIRADTSLSPQAGSVSHVDTNIFSNCGPNSITTTPSTWVPPYSYPLDAAAGIPALVQQWAGVGKIAF
jgi:pectate lyase